MSSTLRIVHLIVRLEQGGAEQSLLRLVSQNLATTGSASPQEHFVICFGAPTPLAREIEKAGVVVRFFDLTPFGLWRVARLLQELEPTHLQGWMYYGNLIASILGKFYSAQGGVLWNIRNENLGFSAKVRLTMWVSSFFTPNMIIYNSQAGQKSHPRFATFPNVLIDNGIETDLYRPDTQRRAAFRATLGVADDEIVIALVGRYHPIKGVREFLGMVRQIKQPKLRFMVIGTGMEDTNSELMQLMSEQEIDSAHVTLLGERRDLPEVYPGLDLLVLASYREGTPNVLLEAMSCGVTVVATEVGDVQRIIQDPRRTCAPHSVTELARVTTFGLAHLGEFTARDRQRILDRYDSARCQTAYRQLYQQLAESEH